MNIARTYSSHQERYYAWIYERQLMWHRRYVLRMSQPWTDDPILHQYRFTNAYRELDRGTLYALQCVLPVATDNLKSLFMRVLTYRVFNKASTYDRIFKSQGYYEDPYYIPDWYSIRADLKLAHSKGAVFTNAHVVATFGARTASETTKIEKVVEFLEHADKQVDLIDSIMRDEQMSSAHKKLMSFENIGDFIAFEVLSDLAYSPAVTWGEDDWANAGPGAREGLDLVKPEGKTNMEKMLNLQESQDLAFHSLGLPLWLVAGPKVHSARLTLRNIEGGLCEYYKYSKCVEGSVRMAYRLGEGYAWSKQ